MVHLSVSRRMIREARASRKTRIMRSSLIQYLSFASSSPTIANAVEKERAVRSDLGSHTYAAAAATPKISHGKVAPISI